MFPVAFRKDRNFGSRNHRGLGLDDCGCDDYGFADCGCDDELGLDKPAKPKKQPKPKKPPAPPKPKKEPQPKKPPAPPKPKRGGILGVLGIGGGRDAVNPVDDLDSLGVGITKGTSNIKQPPPIPAAAVPQSKQGWFTKLLDYGLTKDMISAGVEQVKALAQSRGQQISEQQAFQQYAQNNGIQVGQQMGNTAGSQTGMALDTTIQWVQENFLVVGGVAVLVWALFKQPPGTNRR